jgi:hypothetical protein
MTAVSLVTEAELLHTRIEERASEDPDRSPEPLLEPILARLAQLVQQALIEDDESFYTRDAILDVGAEAALMLAHGDVEMAIAATTAIAVDRTEPAGEAIPTRREAGGRWSHGFVAEAVGLLGYECTLPPIERDTDFALEAIVGAALGAALGMRIEASRRLDRDDHQAAATGTDLEQVVAILRAAAAPPDERRLGRSALQIAPRLLGQAARTLGRLTTRGDEERGHGRR